MACAERILQQSPAEEEAGTGQLKAFQCVTWRALGEWLISVQALGLGGVSPAAFLLEPSPGVILWSLDDLAASPCPPLRGGGMWLLVASAGSTDGFTDRKTFLHFNKSALGYCHPRFPPHSQWQGWAEQSDQVFMVHGMGLSPQPLAKLLPWAPSMTLKDALLHCAHFRLLGILVGAETEEVEEVQDCCFLIVSETRVFFPRLSTF